MDFSDFSDFFPEFLEFFLVYEDFINKKGFKHRIRGVVYSHIRYTVFKSSKKIQGFLFGFFLGECTRIFLSEQPLGQIYGISLVARIVDHGRRNVLIHEEQKGKGEAESHGSQNGKEGQPVQWCNSEHVVVVISKSFD